MIFVGHSFSCFWSRTSLIFKPSIVGSLQYQKMAPWQAFRPDTLIRLLSHVLLGTKIKVLQWECARQMGPGVELKLPVNVSDAFMNNPLWFLSFFKFAYFNFTSKWLFWKHKVTFFLFQLLLFKLLIVDLLRRHWMELELWKRQHT